MSLFFDMNTQMLIYCPLTRIMQLKLHNVLVNDVKNHRSSQVIRIMVSAFNEQTQLCVLPNKKSPEFVNIRDTVRWSNVKKQYYTFILRIIPNYSVKFVNSTSEVSKYQLIIVNVYNVYVIRETTHYFPFAYCDVTSNYIMSFMSAIVNIKYVTESI